MIQTSLLPLALTALIYGVLSGYYPLDVSQPSNIGQDIARAFNLHGLTLAPVLLVLSLALLRVNVTLTIFSGWLAAAFLAMTLQHYSPAAVVSFTLWGFRLENAPELETVFSGGGLWPMVHVCAVVLLSTTLSGLLTGTHSLECIGRWLPKAQKPRRMFMGTALVSLWSAAFGCTQTIAILLTHQLVAPHCQHRRQIALDLENTAVVLAPLIPWNIAGLVPATLLMVGPGFIPFAVYLYLVPLYNLATCPARVSES